jgi:hypothetical protein
MLVKKGVAITATFKAEEIKELAMAKMFSGMTFPDVEITAVTSEIKEDKVKIDFFGKFKGYGIYVDFFSIEEDSNREDMEDFIINMIYSNINYANWEDAIQTFIAK